MPQPMESANLCCALNNKVFDLTFTFVGLVCIAPVLDKKLFDP